MTRTRTFLLALPGLYLVYAFSMMIAYSATSSAPRFLDLLSWGLGPLYVSHGLLLPVLTLVALVVAVRVWDRGPRGARRRFVVIASLVGFVIGAVQCLLWLTRYLEAPA